MANGAAWSTVFGMIMRWGGIDDQLAMSILGTGHARHIFPKSRDYLLVPSIPTLHQVVITFWEECKTSSEVGAPGETASGKTEHNDGMQTFASWLILYPLPLDSRMLTPVKDTL